MPTVALTATSTFGSTAKPNQSYSGKFSFGVCPTHTKVNSEAALGVAITTPSSLHPLVNSKTNSKSTISPTCYASSPGLTNTKSKANVGVTIPTNVLSPTAASRFGSLSTLVPVPRIGDIVQYFNNGWSISAGQHNGPGPYPAIVMETNSDLTLNLLIIRRNIFNEEISVPIKGSNSNSNQYWNVKVGVNV